MQGRHQHTSHKRGNMILSLLGWFMIQSLFCSLPYALAEESFRIAIIDPQAVMENSNAGLKALAHLKEYQMVREKLVEADQEEIQKLEQQLQGAMDRGETKTQVLREKLQGKIQDYQRRVQEFNQELREKQQNVIMEYMQKIKAVTKAVAERRGFSLVIDKGNEAIMQIVIYSAKGMDITDEVVKEFNQTHK